MREFENFGLTGISIRWCYKDLDLLKNCQSNTAEGLTRILICWRISICWRIWIERRRKKKKKKKKWPGSWFIEGLSNWNLLVCSTEKLPISGWWLQLNKYYDMYIRILSLMRLTSDYHIFGSFYRSTLHSFDEAT